MKKTVNKQTTSEPVNNAHTSSHQEKFSKGCYLKYTQTKKILLFPDLPSAEFILVLVQLSQVLQL